MMKGASPKGRRSAPPKLAEAPLRASMGAARSVFRFSARWRSSRDCCAASRWIWWPGKRMHERDARHASSSTARRRVIETPRAKADKCEYCAVNAMSCVSLRAQLVHSGKEATRRTTMAKSRKRKSSKGADALKKMKRAATAAMKRASAALGGKKAKRKSAKKTAKRKTAARKAAGR